MPAPDLRELRVALRVRAQGYRAITAILKRAGLTRVQWLKSLGWTFKAGTGGPDWKTPDGEGPFCTDFALEEALTALESERDGKA